MSRRIVASVFVALASSVDVVTAPPPIACSGIWAPDTSEAALRRRFGSQVRSDKVDVGEGESDEGSVVYPDKPESTLFVIWKDRVGHRNPQSIRVRERSQQVTYGRIGIGTTLKDLERLNGGPFQLAGFAFDYSGTVTSWLDGRLSRIGGTACELKVRLEPARLKSSRERAAYEATIGDRDFKSADPKMQLLNPRVYEVLLIYR